MRILCAGDSVLVLVKFIIFFYFLTSEISKKLITIKTFDFCISKKKHIVREHTRNHVQY